MVTTVWKNVLYLQKQENEASPLYKCLSNLKQFQSFTNLAKTCQKGICVKYKNKHLWKCIVLMMMKVSLDKKKQQWLDCGPEMEPLLQLISISRSLLLSLPHVKQNRPHLLSFFQMLVLLLHFIQSREKSLFSFYIKITFNN